MFCKKCGKDITGADKFCPYCGQPLEKNIVPQQKRQSNRQKVQSPEPEHKTEQPQQDRGIAAMEHYRKYEPVFGNWYFKRLIGEGGFGKVFEIERKDFGQIYRAALKIITIPQERGEIDNLHSEGLSDMNVSGYYKKYAQDIVNEFALLAKLKGNSYIVSYEDHVAVPHEDNIGWDILARMELLVPLTQYMGNKTLSVKDAVRIGIDICHALEVCQKYNIIHRDIKPENIFISELGNFKLGDFGIARQLERSQSVLSKKGTFSYMAPELYKEEKSDASVDIYSLGLVLYRLCNKNRLPFLPSFPQMITYQDKEDALKKRITGEKMPAPADADKELTGIILKACSYKARDRWLSPQQMREALEDYLQLCTAREKGKAALKEHKKRLKEEKKHNRKKKGKAVSIIILLLLILIAGGIITAKYLKPVDTGGEDWVAAPVLAQNQTETERESIEETSKASVQDDISEEPASVASPETESAAVEETKEEIENIYLSSMKLVNSNDRYSQAAEGSYMDSLGNEYYSSNLFYLKTYGETGWGEYGYSEERCAFGEYYLGRNYSTLSGTLAVSDDTSNEDVAARLEIYGDNRVLAYYDLNRKTKPFDIEIDVSKVEYLKFNLVYRAEDGYGDVCVLMYGMALETNPYPVEIVESGNKKLSELKITNGNKFVRISTHARTDVMGNVYSPDNLYELSVYGDSGWGNNGYTSDRTPFAEYCIDQQYSKLVGTIAASDKIDSRKPNLQGKFVVLGDDEVIYTCDVNSTIGPIAISIDVSGVTWIRFEFQFNSADAYGEVYVLLSDFEFETKGE